MSTPNLQADHRNTLWKTLLDAEMNVRYWTLKCSAYTKWDTRLQTTVALAASGTAIASLSIWATHPLAWQCVSVGACVASVFHSKYYPSDRLAKISGLVATWKEIFIDYDLLWEKYDGNLSSNEAWVEFEATRRRERAVDESQFPIDEKLREKAVQQVLSARGLSDVR